MRCVAGKYNEPADEGLHSDASEVSDMSISRFSVRSTQSEQPNRSLRCSVCLPACLPLLYVHYRVAQKSLVHFQHTISSEPFKIKRNGFHRNVPRVSSLQRLERFDAVGWAARRAPVYKKNSRTRCFLPLILNGVISKFGYLQK